MDGLPIKSSVWIFKWKLTRLLFSSVLTVFPFDKSIKKESYWPFNFFWYRIFYCKINFFHWQEKSWCYEKSSCGKKFLTMARNLFLWQDISFQGKFLFVILLLHKKISSFCRKAFVWPELFASFWRQKISCQICDENAWISANISCVAEDFLGAWLPGPDSQGISHPACFLPFLLSFYLATLLPCYLAILLSCYLALLLYGKW